MKWLHRYVERNKPQLIEELGFAWPLLMTRWFGLGLVMRFRSDSSFDQRNEANRLILVLDGSYLDHYEIPRTGEHEPAVGTPDGAYTYGNQYGLWVCVERIAWDLVSKPVGSRGGVELLPPRNTEERIIDYPEWMDHEQVVFDGERPVLMLVLTWGGCWR